MISENLSCGFGILSLTLSLSFFRVRVEAQMLERFFCCIDLIQFCLVIAISLSNRSNDLLLIVVVIRLVNLLFILFACCYDVASLIDFSSSAVRIHHIIYTRVYIWTTKYHLPHLFLVSGSYSNWNC